MVKNKEAIKILLEHFDNFLYLGKAGSFEKKPNEACVEFVNFDGSDVTVHFDNGLEESYKGDVYIVGDDVWIKKH
jgi:hypothetical protein